MASGAVRVRPGPDRRPSCDGGPMVGREAELALARDLFGSGRGLVIVGVPGVGKTRLASELAAQRAGDGSEVMRVVATRSAASIPLGAFGALVPSGGGPDVQTINAIVETARADLADRGPLVLMVDDAHLLDDASAALLHRLVLDGVAVPVMTVRSRQECPDSVVALWKDGHCRRIELRELSTAESAQLIEYSLPGPVDEVVVQRLCRLARGNPMLLRELMRGSLDEGVLAVRHGAWMWNGPFSVAPSLVDTLAVRLSAIESEARDLLMLVAFAEPLSGATIVSTRGDAPLERLLHENVIEVDDDGMVRLAHPLYGEIVRSGLTVPTITRLSRELALAHPDVIDDPAAELRRVVWHVDAGVIEDPDELLGAIKYAQLHDLELARRLAAAAVRAGAGIETRLRLADILTVMGRLDDADAFLAALRAEPLDDRARASVASMHAGLLLWLRGEPAAARAVLDEAEAALGAALFSEELSGLRLQAVMQEGQCDELAVLVCRMLDSSISSEDAKSGAYVVGVAAWLLAAQLDTAIERCTSGLDTTQRSADAFPMSDVLKYGLALGWLYRGDLDAAEARFQMLRRDAARETDVALRFLFSQGLGRVAMLRGQLMAAIDALHEARALVRVSPDLIAWNLGLLGQAQAMAGMANEAQASVDEARGLTASALFEPDRGRADALIAWARGERSRAAATSIEVVDRALELGQKLPALMSAHDAARFGAGREARARLERILDGFPGLLAPAFASHICALESGDAQALARVSEEFALIGCWRVAADSAGAAAAALAEGGLRASAEAAARRARDLGLRAEHRVIDLEARQSVSLLTNREREVAVLAARGESDRSIARALNVSVRTVETHLHRVYSKLGIEHGRTGLRELAHLVDVATT